MSTESSHQVDYGGFSPRLPGHYDKPALGIMYSNPQQIFVYWELPSVGAGGDFRFRLRLFECSHDPPEDADPLTELDIQSVGSRYISIPIPGLAYYIDIVAIGTDGSKKKLLSNRPPVSCTAQVRGTPPSDGHPSPALSLQTPPDSGAHSDGKGESPAPGIMPDINPRLATHSSWSFPGHKE